LRAAAIDRAYVTATFRKKRLVGDFGIPQVYANLGNTHLKLGDPERALEAFLHQRMLGVIDPGAYTNIASAFLAAGRDEEAATALLARSLSPAALQQAFRRDPALV
jgi:hypothetical protein